MENVVPFHTPSIDGDKPSDSATRAEAEVISLHDRMPGQFAKFDRVDHEFEAFMNWLEEFDASAPPAEILSEASPDNGPSTAWMRSHARQRADGTSRHVPPPQSAPPPLACSINPIRPVARPRIIRDLTADMDKLLPVDRVLDVLDNLVPAECLAMQGISSFLADWSTLKGRKSFQLENHVREASEEAKAQCLRDVETLSKTDLREHYRKESDSHRNRKGAAKKNGWRWHPDFDDFGSFLRILGPIPEPGYTLDRIDPHDTEYAPGKVRWLDKRGQANNRKCTITKTFEDVTQPLSVWAEVTKQPYDRLYRRHNMKWTDEQVIFGKVGKDGFDAEAACRPWNHHDDDAERERAERFFQHYSRPGETPLGFCARYFRDGTAKWEEFLESHVGLDPNEDSYSGIAPHCLPRLKDAEEMLRRLQPIGEWLKRALAGVKAPPATPAANPERSRRRSTRKIDFEVYHQNRCENYPELADIDDVGDDEDREYI